MKNLFKLALILIVTLLYPLSSISNEILKTETFTGVIRSFSEGYGYTIETEREKLVVNFSEDVNFKVGDTITFTGKRFGILEGGYQIIEEGRIYHASENRDQSQPSNPNEIEWTPRQIGILIFIIFSFLAVGYRTIDVFFLSDIKKRKEKEIYQKDLPELAIIFIELDEEIFDEKKFDFLRVDFGRAKYATTLDDIESTFNEAWRRIEKIRMEENDERYVVERLSLYREFTLSIYHKRRYDEFFATGEYDKALKEMLHLKHKVTDPMILEGVNWFIEDTRGLNNS